MNAILSNLQYTLTFLIVLSILVVAHEWGHFIVARLFGIRVDDFSIGFGKRVWRIGKRGDTEYNLRLLPFGGFVKIAGMAADEEPLVRAKDKVLNKDADFNKDASDPDAREVPLMAENIETASDRPPAPDEFGSKALWQRSLVIFAGPFMSFVTGYVIFCLMGVLTGVPSGKVLNKIALVDAGGEGQRVGLHLGDEIVAVNGQPITTGEQMIARINGGLGQTLTLTVRNDGQTRTVRATPRPALGDDKKPVLYVDVTQPGAAGQEFGLRTGDTLRGIDGERVTSAAQAVSLLRKAAGKTVDVVVTRPDADDAVTLHAAVPPALTAQDLPTLNAHPIGILQISPAQQIRHMGLRESVETGGILTLSIFANLADLVHRHKLGESTGGAIFMYQATALAVKSGPATVLNLMASLSISLAIFNLFPIPILDGGHLLSFFIEWVRRGRKMTDQQQQAFLMTGLFIIGTLFIWRMGADILRTIHHQLPQ